MKSRIAISINQKKLVLLIPQNIFVLITKGVPVKTFALSCLMLCSVSSFAQSISTQDLLPSEELIVRCPTGSEADARSTGADKAELRLSCKTVCKIYIGHDPYVVSSTEYFALYAELPDGKKLNIDGSFSKSALEAKVPGLKNRLISNGSCQKITYLGDQTRL